MTLILGMTYLERELSRRHIESNEFRSKYSGVENGKN